MNSPGLSVRNRAKNNGSKSTVPQSFGERNNQRRFAGSTQREIADTDYRIVEPQCRQNSGFVKLSRACKQQPEKRGSPARLDRLQNLQNAIGGARVLLNDG